MVATFWQLTSVSCSPELSPDTRQSSTWGVDGAGEMMIRKEAPVSLLTRDPCPTQCPLLGEERLSLISNLYQLCVTVSYQEDYSEFLFINHLPPAASVMSVECKWKWFFLHVVFCWLWILSLKEDVKACTFLGRNREVFNNFFRIMLCLCMLKTYFPFLFYMNDN